MKTNSIEKSFTIEKILKIDFQNFHISWKASKSITWTVLLIYGLRQSQPEPPKNHPEPGERQWKFNIKEVLREKLNSYLFSLIQIVNFSQLLVFLILNNGFIKAYGITDALGTSWLRQGEKKHLYKLSLFVSEQIFSIFPEQRTRFSLPVKRKTGLSIFTFFSSQVNMSCI